MHNLNNILNESYKIDEGAKFGQKEVSDILSRSGDFNIGIEYEFNMSGGEYDRSDVENILNDGFGIKHIDKVVPEHDSMIEVITEKMSLKDAIQNIKGMFEFLNSDMASVKSFAGMHISISTNKYDLSDFNKSKFTVLLNSEYIHKIFPERRHVENVSSAIKQTLGMFKNHYSNKDFTSETIETLESIINEKLNTKYLTATMKDYNMMDGRIELRFFGGENYHTMFDKIKQQVLRSLFIMELAYTDLYQKEYYKELYKFIKPDDPMVLDKKVHRRLLLAIKNKDLEEITLILTLKLNPHDPNGSFLTLQKSLQKSIKNVFKNSPDDAYMFAEEVLHGRFEEGEESISQDADTSYYYALLLKERFPQGEEKIFSDLSMDKIEHYVNVIVQHINYKKNEIIEMFANMPEDIMQGLVSNVMDDRGEELTQEMGERIFSLSSRAAEFAVEYLLNQSDVKNAENMAYSMNNAYLKTYDSSLIDEERIMEKIRSEKSPSVIGDIVSNVYLSVEESIEVMEKIYNIFKKVGIGINDDGTVEIRVADMIQDSIANRSPEVVEAFQNLTGATMVGS